MQDLNGKTAVITGAASGIGRAMAARFAAAGMKVEHADIEAPVLDEAVAALRASGSDAIGVVTDVTKVESVAALSAAAIAAFGQVNVVCNNAGVAGASLGTPTGSALDLADWKWVMDVNFWGVVHGHHVFLPHLLEHGDGHIVNTASMAGHFPGHSAYSASKWAVVGLSEGLFQNLRGMGSTVGVSCLCPGWVDTKIADSTRNRPEWAAPSALGEPSEEAEAETEARDAFIREQLASGMAPDQVANLVHDAILAENLWVFTDPTMVAALQQRFDAVLGAENPGVFDLGQALSQTN